MEKILKFLLIAFLLFTLLISPIQSIAFQDNFENIPDRIVQLYKDGKYEDAISSIQADSLFNQKPSKLNFIAKCFWDSFQIDSASTYYFNAYRKNKKDNDQKVISLLGLVDYNLKNLYIEQANKAFQLAKKVYSSKSLDLLEHKILFREANLMYYTNKQNSIKLFKKCLSLYADSELEKNDVYGFYWDLVLESDPMLAENIIEEQTSYLKKNFPQNSSKFYESLLFKAYTKNVQGNYEEAIKIYQQDIFPLISKKENFWALYLQSEYHRLINFTFIEIKDYFNAIENHSLYLSLADKIYPETNFRVGETYLSMSQMHSSLGNLQLSEDYLNKALTIWEELNLTHKYIFTLRQKAFLLEDKGDIEQSKQLFNQLYYLLNDNKDYLKEYSDILVKQASYLYGDSEADSAHLKLKKALDIYKYELNEPLPLEKVLSYKNLEYRILILKGKKYEANELAKEMMGNFKGEINSSHVKFLLVYTYYLNKENHFQKSIDLINNLLKNPQSQDLIRSENLKIRSSMVEIYKRLGNSYKAKYKTTDDIELLYDAYQIFNKGITLFNNTGKGIKFDNDKIINKDYYQKIFNEAIEVCFTLYNQTNDKIYLEKGFEFSELSKAGSLYDALNRNIAIKKTNIPDSILLKINSLKSQSNFLNNQITSITNHQNHSNNDSIKLQNLIDLRRKTRESILGINNLLEKNYNNYYQLNYNNNLESIETIQSKLKKDEGIIEYFIGSRKNYAFLISKNNAKLLELSFISDSLIQKFHQIIQPEFIETTSESDSYKTFTKTSYYLYSQLLDKSLKFFKDQNIKNLFIVPDKELSFIPFELLIKSKPPNSIFNYKKLDYMLNHFNISYSYSSNILFKNGDQNNDYNGRLLAVGPSYDVFNSDSKKNKNSIASRDAFTPLKFNQEEISLINQFYPGNSITGTDATEENFIKNLESHDIIHLAMHALLDIKNPSNSKLVFTPSIDSLTDYFLHTYEIYNLNVNSQLTVLSACNTGSGKLINEEGVMSLARAFTYAGSKSVAMSHWQVDDESSKDIMKYFYENLSKGLSKSESLRNAKLDYLKNADHFKAHPYYWAAFVLIGDDGPIITEKNYSWLVYLLLSVSLLIPGIVLFRRFTKSNAFKSA